MRRIGMVEYVDANKIVVRYDRTDEDRLVSFEDDLTTYELPGSDGQIKVLALT